MNLHHKLSLFALCLYIALMASCSSCEPTQTQQTPAEACQSVCTIGSNYCDLEGAITHCVDNGQGCGIAQPKYRCEDEVPGTMCYSGACVSVSELGESKLELAPEDRTSLISEAVTSLPLDARVVIIPHEALFQALEGRAFQEAAPDLQKLAVETTAYANDLNTLGVFAEVEQSSYFEGDIFLVPMDPVLVEEPRTNPFGHPFDGQLGQVRLEAAHYLIVAASGLSGYASWVGKNPQFALATGAGLPSQGCCGGQPTTACTGGIPALGPGFGGGKKPCSGTQDCPFPDALEQFIIPGLTIPRFGAELSFVEDPKGLTAQIALRSNGQPLIQLYSLQDRSFYEQRQATLNADLDTRMQGLSPLTFPDLMLDSFSEYSILGCDMCKIVECGGNDPFGGGQYNPSPAERACLEGKVRGPDTTCYHANADELGGSCFGTSPTLFGAGGANAPCFHLSGLTSNGGVSLGNLGGFDETSCGSGLPEYCKNADAQNPYCSSSPEAAAQVTNLMQDLLNCGQGKAAQNQGMSCCDSGSSCVCFGDSEVSFCTSCNENGNCTKTSSKNVFDDRLFVSTKGDDGATYVQVVKDGKVLLCPTKEDGTYSCSMDEQEPEPSPEPETKSNDSKTEQAQKLSDLEQLALALKNNVPTNGNIPTPPSSTSNNKAAEDENVSSENELNKKPNKKPSKETQLLATQKADTLLKKTDEKNKSSDENAAKSEDPVILATGEFVLNNTDLSFNGPGLDLEFRRYYGSQSSERSALGSNWSHNYSTYLQIFNLSNAPDWLPPYCKVGAQLEPSCVLLHDGDGKKSLFIKDRASAKTPGMIVFMPQAGDSSTLYFQGNAWFLRSPEGTIQGFDELGHLTSIVDRFDNKLIIKQEPNPLYGVYLRYCKSANEPELKQLIIKEEQAAKGFKPHESFDKRICVLLAHGFEDEVRPTVNTAGIDLIKSPLQIPALASNAAPLRAERSSGLYSLKQPGDLDRYRALVREGLSQLEFIAKQGHLTALRTGPRRLRPVSVQDSLGRKLTFSYYRHNDSEKLAGLLKTVAGPLGVRLNFKYSQPANYPSQLNEMFLVKVERHDAPSAAGIAPSLPRTREYTYNWPNQTNNGFDSYTKVITSSSFSQITPISGPAHEVVRERFLHYFSSYLGCEAVASCRSTSPAAEDGDEPDDGSSFFGCTGLGSAEAENGSGKTAGTGLPKVSVGAACNKPNYENATGNPCFEAARQEAQYISQVADNIVRVQRHGQIIESETLYEVNPFDTSDDTSSQFDYAIAQRFGGSKQSEFAQTPWASRASLATQAAWTSELMPYDISYLSSGPSGANVDADITSGPNSFLPAELKARYVLEKRSSTQAWNSVYPCFRTPQGCGHVIATPNNHVPSCDYSTFELISRDQATCNPNQQFHLSQTLPGWRPWISYYDLEEAPLEGDIPKIVRSRLTCEQLAQAQVGRANHNDSIHTVALRGGKKSYVIESNYRKQLEINQRRICKWTKIIDRDGDVLINGLNYMGLAVVSAVQDPTVGGWLVTENIFNADGNLLEERNTQLAQTSWSQARDHGYTEYIYDELNPNANSKWNEWLPFWWTRRQNATIARTYPDKTKGSTWAHLWPKSSQSFEDPSIKSLEGQEILYTEVATSYEPLFNQVLSVGYRLQTAQRSFELQKIHYIYDYQEFALESEDLFKALQKFVPWGFRLPDPSQAADYLDVLKWMLPVHFYDQNINGDTYADGSPIVGFPSFSDDTFQKSTQRIKGSPIAMIVEDDELNEKFVTLIQSAPHGLPRAVFYPNKDATFLQYYRATPTANGISGPLYGPDMPSAQSDSDGLFRGLLAKTLVPRYDLDYPTTRNPSIARPICDALAGPYQWIIPTGCSGSADARTKLQSLGLPQELQDELFKAADINDQSQWDETSLSYNLGGWPRAIWHNEKRVSYIRNTDGRIVRETDHVGNVTSYIYDRDNQVVQTSLRSIQETLLRQVFFEYDDDGEMLAQCVDVKPGGCAKVMSGLRIAFDAPREQEDPSYLLSTYRYTPSGELYQLLSPTGVLTTYLYNSRGILIDETMEATLDPASAPKQIRYTYDPSGLLTQIKHGTDRTRQQDGAFDEHYIYDGLHRLRTHTDQRGVHWHQAYDVHGQQLAYKQAPLNSPYGASYSPSSWEIISLKDSFGRTRLTNLHGLSTSRAEYDPQTSLLTWSESLGESKTWFTYNQQGQPVWSIDEEGNQSISLMAPRRRAAAQGELPELIGAEFQAQLRSAGAAGQQYLTTTSWTEFDYQEAARRSTVAGHLGERQTYTISEINVLGHVLKSVNPEGAELTYERNLIGWPEIIKEQKTLGTSQYDISQLQYNFWGLPTRVTDPKGDITIKRYNGFGQLQEHYMPWSNVNSAYEQYGYDGYGRPTKRWLATDQGPSDELKLHYDLRGDFTGLEWVNAPSSLNQKLLQQRTYDELGRLITATDHNLKSKLAGAQHTSVTEHYTWDNLGRLESQGVEFLGQGARYNVDSSYLYDPQTKRWQRQVTYPDGHFLQRHIDRLGRLSTIEHRGQQTQLHWQGELYLGRTQDWSMSNADPLREFVEYDGLGRRTSLTYRAVDLNAAAQPTNASWGQTYCNGNWQVACQAPLWQTRLKHDVMGRVVSTLRSFGHPTIDLQGQLSTGRKLRWQGYHYSAQGHLVAEWESNTFDPNDFDLLPNHLATQTQVEALGQQAQGQQWTWQREADVGSLISIHKTNQPSDKRWEHLGNRLPGHQLREVRVDGASFSLSHDARGRITQGTRHNFEYDVLGRLVAAIDPQSGQAVERYIYGSSGHLLRVIGAQTQTHVYDGEQIAMAYDEQGQLQWRAIWGALQDQLLEFEQGTQRYGVLRDERHSVVGLWSYTQAQLTELGDYDAHGRMRLLTQDEQRLCEEEGQNQVCARLDGSMPFGFNTAWRSSMTGLSFMRARWYSAQLGQFVGPDPLEYVDSYNSYAFAAFDPINSWDPWGTKAKDLPGPEKKEKEEKPKPKPKNPGDNYKHPYEPKVRGWASWSPDQEQKGKPASGYPISRKDYEKGLDDLQNFISVIGAIPGVGEPFDLLNAAISLYRGKTADALLNLVGVIPYLGSLAVGAKAAKVVKAAKATKKLDSASAASAAKKAKQGDAAGICKGGSCKNNQCFVAGTMVWQDDDTAASIESLEVDSVVIVTTQDEPPRSQDKIQPECAAPTTLEATAGVWLSLCDGQIIKVKGPEFERWQVVLGARYTPGDLHATDVTPLLWRRLTLELHQPSGEVAKLSLLRPLWWLDSLGVQEGSWLNLEIDEAGLTGQAQVLAVMDDVKHDSRALSKQQALVIGTIAHEQAQVLRLTFDDGQKDVLGITPTHPLYSTTRQSWVQAQQLRLGEVVTTQQGKVATLVAIEASDELQPIFNLEVHRAQSYYVGQARLLAHNTGINCANVYKSIKEHPEYPLDFKKAKDGMVKNKINNLPLLEELRKIEPGVWQKVYRDGYSGGAKVSIHYFESRSGQVFNVKVRHGWSNSSSK